MFTDVFELLDPLGYDR